MNKRIAAILMAVCMMMLCMTPAGESTQFFCPLIAEATQTKGKSGLVSYSMDGDTLVISGNTAIADYDVLAGTSAPWTRGNPSRLVIKEGITGIGSEAFSGMSSLTEAVLRLHGRFLGCV